MHGETPSNNQENNNEVRTEWDSLSDVKMQTIAEDSGEPEGDASYENASEEPDSTEQMEAKKPSKMRKIGNAIMRGILLSGYALRYENYAVYGADMVRGLILKKDIKQIRRDRYQKIHAHVDRYR
jgi:hypothetical protein